MVLEIKRANTTICIVEIDEGTVMEQEFMGMDKITTSFIVPAPLPIQVDDYVLYGGKKYSIKNATQCQEIDNETYKYDVVFYGVVYSMYDTLIKHLGRTKFSYTGTPLELLGLLIDNLNEVEPGWTIGNVELIDEPITFPFDQQSCRVALTDIAEKFKLEYYVENKAIFMLETIGTLQPIVLKYGRGQGLYTMTRQPVDQPFATVWYGFGGTQNLPDNYRDGQDRITFEGGIIERNVDLYKRKEGSITFDDVFPQRTGTISAIAGENEVSDVDLDFNLNNQFISDGGAKIVFKTGDLGGNEFVISSYNHSSKTIRFGSNKEESGYVLPNSNVHAEVGDKYTIIGIIMPQTYVDVAEAEVRRRTEDHAKKNSHPPVQFPLDIDEKFIREMGYIGRLKPGDSLHVLSETLGVDAPMRLQSISFPLVNPANLKGVISDVLQYTQQERIVKEVKQNKKLISNVQAQALYARQVADEIANAAILEQFKRTYVGDLAVLSGAFVVGNPEDGEVGGINGTGSEPTEVGFFLGSTFANRENAPFNVRRNGKAYATALEVKDGCKIGNFSINNGVLRSSDYSGSGISGMWISDEGIVSRNAGASLIPASTGITIEGSFFGETSKTPVETPNLFPAPVSAGVIGIRRSELTSDALNNTSYCRGVYGGFFSSIKNIGAEFQAVRWSSSGSGDEAMTYNDRLLIVQANRSAVILPVSPDMGMIVQIKNARNVDITVSRGGSNDAIIQNDNTLVNSFILNSGNRVTLIYLGNGNRWLMY